MMKLIKKLWGLPLKFRFRTQMESPFTGRPMTGFFMFLEGKLNWDEYLEKIIKEAKNLWSKK